MYIHLQCYSPPSLPLLPFPLPSPPSPPLLSFPSSSPPPPPPPSPSLLPCRGLLALWRYMRTEMGLNTDLIWEDIKDVVIRTIIRWEDEREAAIEYCVC